MKTTFGLLVLIVVLHTATLSRESEPVEATFKAAGNCGMCKTRIEKSLTIEGVTGVRWDKRTHKVTVEFLSPLTLDSLQRRVAAAGHDTEKFKAPDSIYTRLPDCCLYRDSKKRH